MAKVIITDTCWIWTGSKSNGYGVISVNGKRTLTHRLSLQIACPQVDILGMPKPQVGRFGYNCVLHSCNNPSCVNPNHLRIGSPGDNAIDKVKRMRATGEYKQYLTREQFSALQKARGNKQKVKDLADEFGLNRSSCKYYSETDITPYFDDGPIENGLSEYDQFNPYLGLVRDLSAFNLDRQDAHPASCGALHARPQPERPYP